MPLRILTIACPCFRKREIVPEDWVFQSHAHGTFGVIVKLLGIMQDLIHVVMHGFESIGNNRFFGDLERKPTNSSHRHDDQHRKQNREFIRNFIQYHRYAIKYLEKNGQLGNVTSVHSDKIVQFKAGQNQTTMFVGRATLAV